ncbi:nucleoside deaminase [Aminipila butyrica]|uniref:tRNA-specific adenosine deaminase n=1 Tax=Aminipila butyrica TaxID=433296 RepID=A0A858BS10_9FIRM|nr:tRNA adenosine(34) deaminase TadA [Aminipila butyrica]QIB68122.1 nucleoside deaminase [Aminipila butyrica]
MIDALDEARKAYSCGEIPIGAVVEKDGQIIGRGYNQTETLRDPTAHAEMIAIREAAKTLGGWRLAGCELYVTCEPCAMCAGAMVWSRIHKVHIGTMDPKGGACGSVFNIIQEEKLNHFVEIETGLMEAECASLLKSFFRDLRQRGSRWKKQKESELTK